MKRGIVYLVGAGPGDPGLITLRGLECLKIATTVMYDRLIDRSLLTYARHAKLIDVGKQPDCHRFPQAEINAMLIEKVQAGETVVRLKGGDPFVFGRGGEEATALAEAGLPFEIVPGVTSAIAVPAYAGIPITYRGLACSVTFATGHRAAFVEDPACDWKHLGCGSDTLVFLMGVCNLPYIVEQLIAHGRPPDTPAALVERGTLADQKIVTGTLVNIVELAAAIRPPAALIIGEVVRLRESLRWFDLPDRRPLLGLHVLNTRPLPQAEELSWRLMALGAQPVHLPTTQVLPVADSGPLDAAINSLQSALARSGAAQPRPEGTKGNGPPAYDWVIFTSADSVSFFLSRLFALGCDVRVLATAKLVAADRITAEVLGRYGLMPDLIPTGYTGRDIVTDIGGLAGQRVLLPCADIVSANPSARSAMAKEGHTASLADALQDQGALVDTVTVYTIRSAEPDPVALSVLLDGKLDVATFTSPCGVTLLTQMLENRAVADVLLPLTVACIGPTTANAAHALGVRVDVVAEEHTIEGLVEALVKWRTEGRT